MTGIETSRTTKLQWIGLRKLVMALVLSHTILKAEHETTVKIDIRHLTRRKTEQWRRQKQSTGSHWIAWLSLADVDIPV